MDKYELEEEFSYIKKRFKGVEILFEDHEKGCIKRFKSLCNSISCLEDRISTLNDNFETWTKVIEKVNLELEFSHHLFNNLCNLLNDIETVVDFE